jgi:hypothetical protein
MSDYVKATNFAIKDGLPTGDPNKKVKGTEINDEFVAIQTAIATKANLSSPALIGSPTAPTPSISDNSSIIVTSAWVRALINTIEPIGTIKAWAGTVGSIPAGWAVCNGTNGTLNLTDKFIVGFGAGNFPQNTAGGHTAGAASVPVTGSTFSNGSHAHTTATAGVALTVDQIPAHAHTVSYYANNSSVGTNPGTTGSPTAAAFVDTSSVGGSQAHAHGISADGAHVHTIDGTSASAALPGYFCLAFIQKISNI